MKLSDQVRDALGTLWRQKLRTSLTLGGVAVAIATLVALLAFASGMERSVSGRVEQFDLLRTLSVSTSTDSVAIDSAAIRWITSLPGVLRAFPQQPFTVTVIYDGDTSRATAQALPANARGTLLLKNMVAGQVFGPASEDSVLITDKLLEEWEIEDADSLLGRSIILRSRRTHPDSGMAEVRESIGQSIGSSPMALIRFAGGGADSVMLALMGEVTAAYMRGYAERVSVIEETLAVAGVASGGSGWTDRLREIVLPEAVARRLEPMGIGTDPMDMMNAVQSGRLFAPPAPGDSVATWRQLTLEMDDGADHDLVADSLRAHGFEVSQFQEFYREFRKTFAVFTAGLTLLGGIALFVAALGIVNTMVTSILERRREIGVLKALGAEDGDIRVLFLVESAVIGLLGSGIGLLLGWGGAELGAVILKSAISEMGDVDLIHVGPMTVTIALLFGLTVSTLAGLYPAGRAARLDPVQALRDD